MSDIFVLPLKNVPQVFNISLGPKNLIMTCKWNDSQDAGWVMDLADQDTNELIASNIPLITGVDILAGLQYLGFDGQLVVVTDGDINAVPTLENLGVECNVYFITPSDPTVIS